MKSLNEQFVEASSKGDLTCCKILIDQGADSYNWSMIYAVKYGHIDVVKLLLEYGAGEIDYDWFIIQIAINRHEKFVKLFLEYDDYTGRIDYNMCMRCATMNNNENIVRLMLDYGADFDELPNGDIKNKIIKESREERNNLKMVLEYLVGDPSFAVLMSDELVKVYD